MILFPTLQKELEKESLEALEQREYGKALTKIDELLSYQVYKHDLIIGKLVCLMELGRYDEAEEICEELLVVNHEHYESYLHIYLTILLQKQQFSMVIQRIEDELENNLLSPDMRDQLQQLHHMALQMNVGIITEQSTKLINDLWIAIDQEEHVKQWRIIESLRNMKIQPPHAVLDLLHEQDLHPVVQTSIFKWFVDQKLQQEIIVRKFGQEVRVHPNLCKKIREHTLMVNILAELSDVEQSNPSLFIMLEQILYRYLYVRYPLLPEEEESIKIATALKLIGKHYLLISNHEQPDKDVSNYVDEIFKYEKLYLEIIEE